MLLEAVDRLKDEMGLQLVDEFVQLTDDNTNAKVLLTNSSGITQQVEEGTKIRVILPVAVHQEIAKQLKDMQEGSVLQPSSSPLFCYRKRTVPLDFVLIIKT